MLEERRLHIAKHLEEVNPEAAKKLHEHQKKIDEILKRESPEKYERLMRFREEMKDLLKDS